VNQSRPGCQARRTPSVAVFVGVAFFHPDIEFVGQFFRGHGISAGKPAAKVGIRTPFGTERAILFCPGFAADGTFGGGLRTQLTVGSTTMS
jgi:hypothetical protein